MSYPVGWDLVNITGTYIGKNGVPCVGSVTLSSPQLVLRSGTIVPAADIVFDLVNGAFSGQIPATDDPNANPSGWTYTVTENVPGGRQGIQIVAPHTSPGIDLSTVIPVTMPMPPTFGFPYVTLAQLAGTTVGDGAYLIGFQNPAAGSVARTVQSKLLEIPSVFDFGAVGDGVTNDTTAFTAATATGTPIYVPYTSAFYLLTSLSTAQLSLLWGPGVVHVSGVLTPIASQPTFASTTLAGVNITKQALQPAQTAGVNGAVGNGAALYDVLRTGGWGLYGSVLNKLHITAAVPSGQFDVASTTWATSTDLTGGQTYGSWAASNTPSANLGETFSSGACIGMEINVGNRWGNFGLQTDIGGTRYTVGLQLVPDVAPARDGINTVAVSNMTIASPCVITINSHGFVANMGIVFGGTGTLPTGITAGQTYYVSASGLTTNTFEISATLGGAVVNSTGSFVAPITALPSWAGSFGLVTGPSVWGHNWWVGHLSRTNAILGGGYVQLHAGASVATNAYNWTKLSGFWTIGLDMGAGNTYNGNTINFQGLTRTAGYALNFDYNSQNASTATAGSIASPGNFQGFLIFGLSGGTIKIPYFQN